MPVKSFFVPIFLQFIAAPLKQKCLIDFIENFNLMVIDLKLLLFVSNLPGNILLLSKTRKTTQHILYNMRKIYNTRYKLSGKPHMARLVFDAVVARGATRLMPPNLHAPAAAAAADAYECQVCRSVPSRIVFKQCKHLAMCIPCGDLMVQYYNPPLPNLPRDLQRILWVRCPVCNIFHKVENCDVLIPF